MKTLLVLTVASFAAAHPQLLGYPYASPLTYTYTPQVTKFVPKEVEIPVNTIEYAVRETGCKNIFGFNVPCLAEGEARRKRQAEEAVAVEAVAVEAAPAEAAPAEAAPAAAEPAAAAPLLPFTYGYGLPYAAAAYPYAAYPYAAYPYAGVQVAEPKVTEVEVPQYVYKQVVQKVELAPLCHNGVGFAVPCA